MKIRIDDLDDLDDLNLDEVEFSEKITKKKNKIAKETNKKAKKNIKEVRNARTTIADD